MYTSGSSGTPKGVVVEHGALSEFAAALGPELGFTSDDRHLAVTTLSFDISIVETLLPLCHGSMVIVAREDEVREPGRLLELLKQHQVTSMQATPSHWRLLLEAGCTSLQGLKMFVGGEPLSRDLAQALLNTGCARLVNLYGPTEATVWASKHVVTAKDVLPAAPDTVTIGRPLPNYRFYVLNENLDPVPAGVPGDLHIGGLALARGYLGQPELTAERFIADPYSGPGGRMYRTGDRACWRPDGLVDFLGREDQQVKIRGHRVELGEIESLLRKRPGVKDAIVVLRSANQHKRLVGYVISELAENHACQPESTTFGSELREHLRSILPDYMIPVAIVTLPFWPLTPNGKLDRKELPPPPNLDRPAPQEQMTAEEEALCRVFTKALRQNAVTVEDNFFDLGGDSLAAVRVVVAIKADLGVTVIVRDVFESESIRALAEKCARQRGKCEE
jgi:acyl-coenzyme A synthetase/AMP-(fatty) acid ligase/acyl carrier protein